MYITDKIRNMKQLTFLLLLFSIGLSGQVDNDFIGKNAALSGFYENVKRENDTTKCEILISIEGALKVINGYDVSIYSSNLLSVSNDPFSLTGYVALPMYEHYIYLDENKKPVNKNYTIWQTIRK